MYLPNGPREIDQIVVMALWGEVRRNRRRRQRCSQYGASGVSPVQDRAEVRTRPTKSNLQHGGALTRQVLDRADVTMSAGVSPNMVDDRAWWCSTSRPAGWRCSTVPGPTRQGVCPGCPE